MSHIKTRFGKMRPEIASCWGLFGGIMFQWNFETVLNKWHHSFFLYYSWRIIQSTPLLFPPPAFGNSAYNFCKRKRKILLVSISLLSCALLSKLHLKIPSFYSNAKDNSAFVAKANEWREAWTFKITIEILLFLASIGKSYCHSSIPFQWLNVIVW